MNLKLKSYKINDDVYIGDYSVLKTSDSFISALRNLDTPISDSSTHTIELNIDGSICTITKLEEVVTLIFNDASYTSLSELFQAEFKTNFDSNTWKKHFIDINESGVSDVASLNTLLSGLTKDVVDTDSPKKELDNLILQSLESETDENKKALQRFQELTAKINASEEKVDAYNNYQNIIKAKKEEKDSILREKERLVQVLSSSKELIESKARLENEVNVVLEGSDPEQLKNTITQVKDTRMNHLVNYMQEVKAQHKYDAEEKERDLMVPKTFIVILLVQSLVSISLFFVTGDVIAFFYLILGWIIAIGGGILFQIYAYDTVAAQFNSSDESIETAPKQRREFMLKVDETQDKDLIKHAWVEALRRDLDEVVSSLNQRLGSMTYEELQNRMKELETKGALLDEEIKKLDVQKIDQDDYYKFRRELDIYSIERENLLVNLEGKVDNGLIENIKYSISRISDAKKVSETKQIKLPFIIFNLKEKVAWIKDLQVQNSTQVLFFE